jgi:hypothetical protein
MGTGRHAQYTSVEYRNALAELADDFTRLSTTEPQPRSTLT